MLGRKHQSQLIVGVGHHLKKFVELLGKFPTDDRQIDLAVGHTPAGASGAVHLKLNRDVRKLLAEQADHPGHQVSAGGLARADDQRSPFEVVQIIQGTTGLVALTQDPIAITQQQVPGLGELGLAATAVEQRHLKLLLEVLDLKADRRLGDIEAVGRLLEAALADDGAQDAQLVKGERQFSHRDAPSVK